jgi:hypothetical protein
MFFFTLVNQKQEHISWTIKTKYENFIQYLPYIHHSTKKQFAVPPSFRWEFFLKFNQKQELPMSTMFFVQSRWNEQPL